MHRYPHVQVYLERNLTDRESAIVESAEMQKSRFYAPQIEAARLVLEEAKAAAREVAADAADYSKAANDLSNLKFSEEADGVKVGFLAGQIDGFRIGVAYMARLMRSEPIDALAVIHAMADVAAAGELLTTLTLTAETFRHLREENYNEPDPSPGLDR